MIESVEAGLGAPDPQQLAEMDRMAFQIKGETSDSEDGSLVFFCSSFFFLFFCFLFEEPEQTVIQNDKNDTVTNQDGWLNALSLEKLTTTVSRIR